MIGVEFGFLASGIADETEEMEFLGFVSKNGDTTMATSTVTQAIIMSQGMVSIVLEKFVQPLLYLSLIHISEPTRPY